MMPDKKSYGPKDAQKAYKSISKARKTTRAANGKTRTFSTKGKSKR